MGCGTEMLNLLWEWEVNANIRENQVEEEISKNPECLMILQKPSIRIYGLGNMRKTPDVFEHIEGHFHILLVVQIEYWPNVISW